MVYYNYFTTLVMQKFFYIQGDLLNPFWHKGLSTCTVLYGFPTVRDIVAENVLMQYYRQSLKSTDGSKKKNLNILKKLIFFLNLFQSVKLI